MALINKVSLENIVKFLESKKYEKTKDSISHYLRETTFIHNTIEQEEKSKKVIKKINL